MTISFDELKSRPIITPVTKIQSNATENTLPPILNTKDKNNYKKLVLALGGLAVLGVSTFIACNSIRRGKKIQPNEYSLQRIEKFINGLPKDIKISWQNRINHLSLRNTEFVKSLIDKEHSILPLEYLFELKKMRIRYAPDLPAIINLENISPQKAKEITQILSGRYETAYSTTKYTNGYIEEFLETLTKISENSKVNYAKNRKYTFLNIENIDTLLTDLHNPNNEKQLSKFKELVEANVDNHMIYVTNGKHKDFESLKHMKLSFTDEIETLNLANDLSHFCRIESIKDALKYDKISASLLEYMQDQVNLFSHFAWGNKDANILFFDNATSKISTEFLSKLQKIVDDKFLIFDVNKKGLAKLNQEILSELPKAKDLFNRENKYTYWYLDGFEELIAKADKNSEEFVKFKEIIQNQPKDSKLKLIIKNEKQNDALNSLRNNGTQSLKFIKRFELIKLREETIAKIDQNDFSYIDKDKFISEYVNFFVAEKSGSLAYMPEGNGILLYGPLEKAKIVVNSIRKSLDVNYKEYDIFENGNTDMLKAVFDLKKILKASELEYQKTGKRTIVEVRHLDELLTNKTDNVIPIAHFKSYVELASKNYHTTVLMCTDKPLKNFESASIGPNRFPLKLKIKE